MVKLEFEPYDNTKIPIIYSHHVEEYIKNNPNSNLEIKKYDMHKTITSIGVVVIAFAAVINLIITYVK